MDYKKIIKNVIDLSKEMPQYKIAKTVTSAAQDYLYKEEKEIEEKRNKCLGFIEDKKYPEALKAIEELINIDNSNCMWLTTYYLKKAEVLIGMGEDNYQEAKIALDKAKELADCIDSECIRSDFQCEILFYRSYCQAEKNKGGGRKYLIGAIKTDNDDYKKDFLKEYRTCTSNMKFLFEDYKEGEADWNHPDVSGEDREECKKIAEANKFTNINSIDRQLIFVGRDDDHIAGCYDPSNNINWVFTLDYIPSDIKFPIGHPQANTLYIAHPVNKEFYIPFEGSSYNFFIDKVNELCHLLQCLGATEISFKSIKGRETTLEENANWNIGGKVGTKKHGTVGGQYGQGIGSSSYQSNHNEMGLTITADPKERPFLPNDLKWLDTETQWKRLIEQRLNGNLLSYEQKISTRNISSISNSRRQEIKGAFDNFMVCVNANYDSQADSTFKETEETEWQICAKFKPLDEYDTKREIIAQQIEKSTNNTPQIATQETKLISTTITTDNEQSYAEEVKFCLEDGDIGDKERRFLERMRIKLGISHERATEIEKSLQEPQFTENEQEYLDAVKDEIIDGRIPESAKRLLNRLRVSLDISEERATEIESLTIKQS